MYNESTNPSHILCSMHTVCWTLSCSDSLTSCRDSYHAFTHILIYIYICIYLYKNIYHWKANLTHWGWVKYICVSKIMDNGLLSGRRLATIWTSAGISLMGSLGINFSEILIEFNKFSFKKMHLKTSVKSVKLRLFRLRLNELMYWYPSTYIHTDRLCRMFPLVCSL